MRRNLTLVLLVFLVLTGCRKETDNIPEPIPGADTIPLLYVDNPDTSFIILPDLDTVWIHLETWPGYNGPHQYWNKRVWIGSTDTTRIQVSYGRIVNGQLWDLDNDSLVDGTLDWYVTYVSGGNVQGPIGYRSAYVGLRVTENGKTRYGWIHTPSTYVISEYAIDTSDVPGKQVFAGKWVKY